MKRTLITMLVVTLVGVTQMPAGSPSQEERNQLTNHLKQSQQVLAEATRGLSPAQWNFKPSPDRWSIAECLEHIAASEDFLFDLVIEKALKTTAQPDRKDPEKQASVDSQILERLTDRTNRAKAPEPLQPTARYGSVEAAREHFAASRQRTLQFVKDTQADWRSYFWEHPAFKEIDAYQWLLLLSGHTQRHVAQILEVKAHPNFPKHMPLTAERTLLNVDPLTLPALKTIPAEQQIELALSAAPPAISGHATVYVLESKGYVKVRNGTNGFTCLVEQQYADQTVEPVCYDAEGGATTLPARFYREQLRAAGVAEDEVNKRIKARYKSGKLKAPRKPGLAYMLSDLAQDVIPAAGVGQNDGWTQLRL